MYGVMPNWDWLEGHCGLVRYNKEVLVRTQWTDHLSFPPGVVSRLLGWTYRWKDCGGGRTRTFTKRRPETLSLFGGEYILIQQQGSHSGSDRGIAVR